MKNIFTHKSFISYFGNLEISIFSENNNIIKVRTIDYEFIFSKRCSNKTLFSINIKLHIIYSNRSGIYIIKIAQFCFTLSSLPVFFFNSFEIIDCKFNQISQMMIYFVNFIFKTFDNFISLKFIIF